MCLSSRGIIEIDICVSLSYRPSSSTVRAFLQGCTSHQQGEVSMQLQESSILSEHPLLLPIILVEIKVWRTDEEEADLWNLLVDIEGRSEQTGAPAISSSYAYDFDNTPLGAELESMNTGQEKTNSEFQRVTVGVVGVIQRTTSLESHAKALLLSIDEIRKSIEAVNNVASTSTAARLKEIGEILSGKLDLLEHRTRVIMGNIQFVEKRAQAQQSAVGLWAGSILFDANRTRFTTT